MAASLASGPDLVYGNRFLRWYYPDQVLGVGIAFGRPLSRACPGSPLARSSILREKQYYETQSESRASARNTRARSRTRSVHTLLKIGFQTTGASL